MIRALAIMRYRLLLLAASVGVSLLVGEGLVRVFFPDYGIERSQHLMFWQHDTRLGWFHQRGKVGRLRKEEFAIHVRINDAGLRDDAVGQEKGDKFRIVVLGDSFAWGWGVEERERFTEVMEGYDDRIETVNMGVSGYGTDQELILFEHMGRQYRPDLVLVLFHSNDWQQNTRATAYGYSKPFFTGGGDGLQIQNVPVPKPHWAYRSIFLLRRYLVLPNFLWYRIGQLNSWQYYKYRIVKGVQSFGAGEWAGSMTAPHYARKKNRLVSDVRDERSVLSAEDIQVVEIAAALVDRVAALAGADRAPTVLVMTPDFPPGVREGTRRSRLVERLARGDIATLDLSAGFKAHYDVESAPALIYPKDRHWNAAGHRLVARAIYGFLYENGLLPPMDRGSAPAP